MLYVHASTVAPDKVGRGHPLALRIRGIEADLDLFLWEGLDLGDTGNDAVLIIVLVYLGEVGMPEPGHDLIVELVVVHSKGGVAHAVGSKDESVRRRHGKGGCARGPSIARNKRPVASGNWPPQLSPSEAQLGISRLEWSWVESCREWQPAKSCYKLSYTRMLSSVSFGSASTSSQPRAPAPTSPTSAVFAGLDDELHDARRVLAQGQEEDLRCALDRVLNKVEELVSPCPTSSDSPINHRSCPCCSPLFSGRQSRHRPSWRHS